MVDLIVGLIDRIAIQPSDHPSDQPSDHPSESMHPTIPFLIIAFAMLLIGYLAGKGQDEEGYNMYNRALPRRGYFVSYAATYIGAGFFIAGTSFTYQYGLGLAWVFIGIILGGWLFGHFAAHLKEKTQGVALHTLPDFFRWRFGKTAAKLLTAITLFILISDIAVQLIGGGKLLQSLGVLSYSTSILITVFVVGIYLVFSGFRAVVWTDYVLLAAILSLTLILALFSSQFFKVEPAQLNIGKTPWGTMIALLIFGFFEPFGISPYYQRIFAADSSRVAKTGTWLASVLVLFPVAALFVVGIAAKNLFPDIDPDTAFLKVIQRGGKTIALVGSVVLWAALMSTIDTITFAASHILNKDLLGKPLKRKNVAFGIIFLLSIGLLLSFTLPSIMDVGMLFVAGSMIIAPSAFFQWFMKDLKEPPVVVSLVLGVLAVIGYCLFRGIDPPLIGVAFFVSFLSLLLTHFGIKSVQRFYAKKL